MRQIDSKDIWYFGMIAGILGIALYNPFLLITNIVLLIMFLRRRNNERKEETIKLIAKQMIGATKLFSDMFNLLEDSIEEKEEVKPNRRKTSSRRVRRK